MENSGRIRKKLWKIPTNIVVVRDADLRQIVQEQSPWRTTPQWEADDADVRASLNVALDYEPNPLADIHAPGMYVLRGPRRVGKSLELKRAVSQLIAAGANRQTIFYCACDGLSTQDLRRLIASMHNLTSTLQGTRYWFLDEVTDVNDWSKVIKNLRDQNTTFREACVVLSGSSAKKLREATSDLADRRGGAIDSDRLLLPMGFRAFNEALDRQKGLPDTVIRPKDFRTPAAQAAIHELEPWASALDDAWQLYLMVGGFPRAVGSFVRDGLVEPGFVEGLWHVVINDALRDTDMSDAEIASLLDKLVEGMCSPLSAVTVAAKVGLRDGDRVNDRIQDLVANFLGWRCYKAQAGRPQSAAQRKFYFIDPLLARLPHERNPGYAEPDISQLNEQQIGLALARTLTRRDPKAFVDSDLVLYERTDTGAEIDFVGPELGVPFECKYTVVTGSEGPKR